MQYVRYKLKNKKRQRQAFEQCKNTVVYRTYLLPVVASVDRPGQTTFTKHDLRGTANKKVQEE